MIRIRKDFIWFYFYCGCLLLIFGGLWSFAVVPWWFVVICDSLWWFAGGLWWFGVVCGHFLVFCGGLWSFPCVLWFFVVVCGNLWLFAGSLWWFCVCLLVVCCLLCSFLPYGVETMANFLFSASPNIFYKCFDCI